MQRRVGLVVNDGAGNNMFYSRIRELTLFIQGL